MIERCFVQIKVFHEFLGLGDKTTGFPPSKPGVYEIAWEGGMRYRTKPSYQNIADEEQLTVPQTQFEVKGFILGDDAVSTCVEWISVDVAPALFFANRLKCSWNVLILSRLAISCQSAFTMASPCSRG